MGDQKVANTIPCCPVQDCDLKRTLRGAAAVSVALGADHFAVNEVLQCLDSLLVGRNIAKRRATNSFERRKMFNAKNPKSLPLYSCRSCLRLVD